MIEYMNSRGSHLVHWWKLENGINENLNGYTKEEI